MSSIYNGYLVLKGQGIPIVFDIKNVPESIVITNLSNQQQDTVKLNDNIAKIFVPNRGALYYLLEDYNEKSILEIQFNYLFIRVKNLPSLK